MTCIVHALHSGCHKAYGLRLGAPSPFVSVDLACSVSGGRDASQLGVVRVAATGAALIIKREFVEAMGGLVDSHSWTPLVERGALAAWLTGVAVGRTIPLAAVELGGIYSPEEDAVALAGAAETAFPRGRLRYRNPAEYLRTLATWVRAQQRSEEKAEGKMVQCLPRFRVGLDGELRVYLALSALEPLRVLTQVSFQLLIECPREGGDVWVGRATLERPVKKGDAHAVCAVMEHDGLPPSGVECCVRSASSDVTAERMQYAIRLFCSAELSVGSEVFHEILGWDVPPRPGQVRLQLPVTWQAPGLPLPNGSQRAAISAAMFKPRGVTIIQGPPGTGKTDTLAALTYFLVQQQRGRVLLVAPSNAAADNMAQRVHKTGLSVLRLVAVGRADTLPEEITLAGHSGHFIKDKDVKTLQLLERLEAKVGELSRAHRRLRKDIIDGYEREAVAAAQVVVTTCAGAGERRVVACAFPAVIIDEATQATEPESLIPVTRGCQQLVLVGDHKQLGPYVGDTLTAKAGLEVPLFTRLIQNGVCKAMLAQQFRMHPSIARFPSLEFYDGLLTDGVTANDRSTSVQFPWPTTEPVLFHAVHGAERGGGASGTSFGNLAEAVAVADAVSALCQGGAAADQIGIVAPYAEQQHLIRQQIAAKVPSAAADIWIAAVESFQGGEKDFICVSFVRSRGTSIGFVSDPRRLCVALTRARLGLYMVGNPSTLAEHSPVFARMLSDYAQRGVLVAQQGDAFGRWVSTSAVATAVCQDASWQDQVFHEVATGWDVSSTIRASRDEGAVAADATLSRASRLMASLHSSIQQVRGASPAAALLVSSQSISLACALYGLRMPCVILYQLGDIQRRRDWCEAAGISEKDVVLIRWKAPESGDLALA